jgi:predicted nucleic acid-binding protein
MARIVLDTDVASLGYNGRLPLAARLAGHEICVTFVTVGELARWAEKRHGGTRARSELARWLCPDGDDQGGVKGPSRQRKIRKAVRAGLAG